MSSSQVLVDAIMAASPDILREALLRLAFTNGCREAVEQEFLVQSTFERLSLGEPNHQASRSSSTKRRRYETCARCTKEYDVTKNDAGACRWHGGSLDVDWSSGRWKYHREERDGPIDSDVMRQRFPERYVWSCCGTAGDVRNSGCRSGHHAEPGYSEKRVCQSGESMPMEMEM